MMSIADELAKLAKPIEQGVISESEFQQMKQDLISREESTSTIAIEEETTTVNKFLSSSEK